MERSTFSRAAARGSSHPGDEMIQQAERGQQVLVTRWVKQAAVRPAAYREQERATAQQRAEGVFQESLGPARRSAGGPATAIADAIQPHD